MKNQFLYHIFLSAALLFLSEFSYSQSVAINADSSVADASAILDLKSTKKGLLVPRMTMLQRNAIASPATGLLIYQTDNIAGFYYYTGSLWTPLKSNGEGSGSNYWSPNDGDDIFNTNIGNVGIGTVLPNSKLMIKTPLNTTGFTHLGVTDSIGTDSILLTDKLFASYKTGSGVFSTTIPAVASFGTIKKHTLQLHAGDSGWLNIIPDGSVVIGDSAGYHSYFGSRFTVRTPAGTKGVSVFSNDGALVSMLGSTAGSGVGTFTNNDMNMYAGSTPVITAQPGGNVGINTQSPGNTLQIGELGGDRIEGNQLAIGNGNRGFYIRQTDALSELYSASTDVSIVAAEGSGKIGINTTHPDNKFQVGNPGLQSWTGTDFAVDGQGGSVAINAGTTVQSLLSTGDFTINSNFTDGHVGINTKETPKNKLQVGAMGPAGFNGNDIAFGNGTNATGLSQNNAFMQIGSSTNIALMPVIGGTGRVGINTTTPRAMLDVEGSSAVQSPQDDGGFAYYGLKYDNFHPSADYGGADATADVSIYASNNVMALQFDAFSDARIKNISGISDSRKDLQTLNKLEITDYTFKDKIKNGNKQYKKVIAQQVETVYPQIVSKHKDVVPNVYQLTSRIEKKNNGYGLTFASNHNISATAKRLQVIMNDSTSKQWFDIVSIPSSNEVVIKADNIKADQLFVYGEEVDDFRTVDYEGLTTLTISATQELNKQIMDLQKIVAKQKEEIEALMQTVNAMKQPEVTKR